MGSWEPLRARLAAVDQRLTLGWEELDELVGGLPPSAYRHPAFWKGDRSGWPGFITEDVRVGERVTFVRRTAEAAPRARIVRPAPARAPGSFLAPDLVLIGCVKKKRDEISPARDLYVSPLFRKGRAYAERIGAPWFILSAQHRLVAPDEELEPYDRRLSEASREYRRRWGAQVLDQLRAAFGPIAGARVEIHAGAAYVDAILEGLDAAGADVVLPLSGLRMGERLRWYGTEAAHRERPTPPPPPPPEVSELVDALGGSTARSDQASSSRRVAKDSGPPASTAGGWTRPAPTHSPPA